MFGIGLPEFILIMALALIVVGPDKLPDLARSVAKGILELKKTANALKDNLTAEGNPLDDIKPELEEAARSIKDQVLDVNSQTWRDKDSVKDAYSSESAGADSSIVDVAAGEKTDPPAEEDTPEVRNPTNDDKDSNLKEISPESDSPEKKS